MQPATPRTVAGDFNAVSFKQAGFTTRFFRKGQEYWVHTRGPAGTMQDFPVRYVLGVYPLQQLLLPLDGGRLQALQVAWDCRPRQQGGQRWFSIQAHPEAQDPLFDWTGVHQNWNFMCADCHSTGVHKGYDAATRRFDTRWDEISVSCEACHGPGSEHVAWAQSPPERREAWPQRGLVKTLAGRGQWQPETSGQPPRLRQPRVGQEIETCAACHSRRSALTQSSSDLSFHDAFQEATLEAPNYESDGQIREENYEVAAFRQSKMHAAGVSCSDCHQPHSLKLRAPGNQLCLQCHDGQRLSPQLHAHHPAGSAGARCTSCHMPTHTYMGVHQRHDHSMRIPRPDQSVSLGVPNACNQCHQDRTAAWASQAVARWFGPQRKGFQQHAGAFHAARQGSPAAEEQLLNLTGSEVPGVVRATALAELRQYLSSRSLPAVESSLKDDDPAVRLQALRALELADLEMRWQLGQSLLSDSTRAVRLAAVRLLGSAPSSQLSAQRLEALQQPLKELQEWSQALADRPEAQLEMGWFEAQRENADKAEQHYREALRLAPDLSFGYVNLADLYRATGREPQAQEVLRQGLQRRPREASLHHALGLALVRQSQLPQAMKELARAVELQPRESGYRLVWALALQESGQPKAALLQLKTLLKHDPHHLEALQAAQGLCLQLGDRAGAQDYSRRLQQLNDRRQSP